MHYVRIYKYEHGFQPVPVSDGMDEIVANNTISVWYAYQLNHNSGPVAGQTERIMVMESFTENPEYVMVVKVTREGKPISVHVVIEAEASDQATQELMQRMQIAEIIEAAVI